MSHWEKLKVTELKEELKSRGIPLTGLKLKQQLIDKLIEVEGNIADPTRNSEDAASPVHHQPDNDNQTRQTETVVEPKELEHLSLPLEESDRSNDVQGTREEQADIGTGADEGLSLKQDLPQLVQVKNTSEAAEIAEDDPFIPVVVEDVEHGSQTNGRGGTDHPGTPDDVHEQTESNQNLSSVHNKDITNKSVKDSTQNISNDPRKRKRLSATPPLEHQENVKKRARTDSNEAEQKQPSSVQVERIKAATEEAELSRQANNKKEEHILKPMIASSDPTVTRVAKEVGSLPDAPELQNRVHSAAGTEPVDSPSPSGTQQDVVPAKHPATRSLYIRNFKRPLHIPTLRKHISTLAKSSSSPTSAGDPVKIFYLDSIRTHAFITVDTISAATRVRNAMHETKYPEEPMREPLWVDFIPDEKVQVWIDEETGPVKGALGTARSGAKFSVVYQETSNGVEAILHNGSIESSAAAATQSKSSDRPGVASTSTNILGDHSEIIKPRQSAFNQPTSMPHSDTEKGFKALDELFSSTHTKPKLYYKLVNQNVIDTRLDRIRELRVAHSDMGRSGDEGMKRYTFDRIEEGSTWIDKGPEFGFGRKGQDRLAGHRGRGGIRGARRGDSWRGR